MADDGDSFDFVVCSQVQNTSLVEDHKARSPGFFSRPFPFAPGLLILSRGKERALRSAVSCLPPSTEASERRRGSSPGVSGTVPQNVFVFQPKVLFFLFYLLRILGNLPGFALARTAAHPFPSNALLVSCFYIYISETIEHPQEQAPYFIFPFAPTKIFPQI